MDYLPFLTLGALLFIIVFGIYRPKMNMGILSLSFAMVIGFVIMRLCEKEIATLFPSQLFLMLVGITLFFGIADQNGTLKKILDLLIKLSHGNSAVLPITFFFLTFILSAIGPGNIAATALIAPVAMLVATNARINPLVMAIMVCTGANAGAFSPISPTGIISTGLITQIGATDPNYPIKIFLASAGIQSLTALAAYIIFKGYKVEGIKNTLTQTDARDSKLNYRQIITVIAILVLLIITIFIKIPVGVTVYILSGILLMLNIGDGEEAMKRIPWDAIMLVTGITVLIGILSKSGGLELAADLISKISSTHTLNAILALITGIVSAYSSSSGVVMPTFIPLIPSIMEKVGTTDLLHTIIAVNVGSHMVDVSPLSTLGAICIASVSGGLLKEKLFKGLMIWGITMAFVGAILSFLFLDLL